MKFYIGDTVEILSIENEWYPSKEPLPTIGTRFRIDGVTPHENSTYYALWKNSLGHEEYIFKSREHQLRLYKRPFKNWIKYFFKK